VQDLYVERRAFDFERFFRFHLSVLWRASVAQSSQFAAVSLGPFEERFRRFLCGPPSSASSFAGPRHTSYGSASCSPPFDLALPVELPTRSSLAAVLGSTACLQAEVLSPPLCSSNDLVASSSL
jgi:hypothetical protein